jgi:hypothetical protein
LKLLLKIVTGYFFGLHLFGAICLIPWILHADQKYRDYLEECGQGSVWWLVNPCFFLLLVPWYPS